MTSNLVKFDFEGNAIRTITVNDEPWWVLKDVCDVLGLSNSRMVADRLDKDEVSQTYITDSIGRQQDTTIVNEFGLYNVIIRSDKPEAKTFKRWITHEVIPSIRKTGSYGKPVNRIDTIIAGLLAANEVIEEQKVQLEVAHTQLIEQAPKVRFADTVADTESCMTVGTLAKIINAHGVPMGQNRMFETLRNDGYLCTVGQNRNVPTQRAMDLGLFRLKETAITHSDGHVTTSITPKITGKGQLYFFKKYTGKTGEIVDGEVQAINEDGLNIA